jgi:aspartate aminotransferase-like enzyme
MTLLLMTPGPTRVPERVLRAGAHPMIHHRTPEFSAELRYVIEMLGPVFGTRAPVLPVHTSGRGAMEAAICNLFSRGDELAMSCNGEFGKMWAKVAESYGTIVHRWNTDWSRNADPAELEALLAQHPKIRGVAVAYCDTSTGVRNDIKTIARIASDHGALTLVDGVSSLGGMPFEFDAWGVDFAVTASQKCLMSAPGIAFIAMSERAWAANARSTLPRNYWSFKPIIDIVSRPNPETPGTTPVHLIMQVAEAVRMMHEEGLPAVYARHEAMAERVRTGAQELGLALQCPDISPFASTLTAIALPPHVPPKVIREGLRERGILAAAGLGQYKDGGFRIGHMGDIRMADVDRTLSALAEVLA